MKKKHTSDELGVCQQLSECHLPCQGPPEPNRYPFAPGVIDGPTPTEGDGCTVELIAVTIALGAIVAIVGFATGYLSLPGWML